MLLAIDIGNTNVVFAVFKGEQCMHQWRMQSRAACSADEYAAFLLPLFKSAKVKAKSISAIIISSVVPSADRHVSEFCEHYLKQNATMVAPGIDGIRIDIDDASQIGADRIVNAAAIIKNYQTPAIVIDFGTATTFDVIDGNNAYSGGIIAPGIRLSLKALSDAAAKLSSIPIEKPARAIGKTTKCAMQSGLFHGYIGMIDNCVAQIIKELDSQTPPEVIATGGLGRLFFGETQTITHYDPNLTLKGLCALHNIRNKK